MEDGDDEAMGKKLWTGRYKKDITRVYVLHAWIEMR